MALFAPLSVRIAGLLVALSAGFVAACNPFSTPEGMLDEYVKRLARVLDVEAVRSPVPAAPELPRLRERVRPVPELTVGVVDFLGLYGCGLQHVVGERNSSLGRVMHPSSRLAYELRFLQAAEACVPLVTRAGLAERLEGMIEVKRASLPDVAWNAVWGSREIEDLLTRSKGPLRVAPDRVAIAAAAEDLQTLRAIVSRAAEGDLGVDVEALDVVYQRWLRQPLPGQLLRSAVLLTVRLNDAAELVEGRLGDRPLCYRSQRNRRADTLQSMFMAVFIGEVQPYLADVHRARREVLPPLQELAALGGPHGGALFAAYAEEALDESGASSRWSALDAATKRHTLAWQRLLEQCGMRPGQPH